MYFEYLKGTRVELLENIATALQKNLFQPHPTDRNRPALLAADFPTLEQHSQHWTLNKKQHSAFLLMGAALLKHIYNANISEHSETSERILSSVRKIQHYLDVILPQNQQLVMFLAGSGGTGKSRVIQAFTDFSRRWHSTATSVICASTGIASMLILGCTVHSALGLGARGLAKDPTAVQIRAWSEIGVIFIDEFSMIGPAFFDVMEKRLRKLKEQPEKLFGGIHVILSGDFYQLGPVASSPIYKKNSSLSVQPTTFKNGKPRKVQVPKGNLDVLNGQHLFSTCITDVIELNVNLRQKDPLYAGILESLRVNRLTNEQIAHINSRYYFSLDPKKRCPPPFTITAVFQNITRENALRYSEEKILRLVSKITSNEDFNWRKRGVILIIAKISLSAKKKSESAKQNITKCDEERIGKIGSSKLKFPLKLFCILDAPYMVRDNSDVGKGVANGTPCWLQDVVILPTATIGITELPNGDKVHSVSAADVNGLVFKHKNQDWTTVKLFPSLPPGCFPVQVFSKSVTLEYNKGTTPYKKYFKILQFPCELSMILTGHKVQGITTDSIILGGTDPLVQYGKNGWYYVIFSRVTSLDGLYLMQKIEEDSTKYIPRYDVEDEMKRLRAIEQQTIARLSLAKESADIC